MIVEIRTSKGLASAATLLRQEVQAFNRQIPVNVESFSEQIGQTALRDRMTAILAGFFGCLALLLALIGLYGIMSYTVIRRTSELGIRMALGAQATDVTWMILRETLLLAIIYLTYQPETAIIGTWTASKHCKTRSCTSAISRTAAG